ncbi:MAG: DUF1893 domain-containing protein [Sphaerochaetaceae bacterium]|nr:DUF1893 domain-containing protein [Sphaerochaetaceae bacterium]
MENYLTPLPEETSMIVYYNDKEIFFSKSKWLIPLFELEQFLENGDYKKENLSIHDRVAGKAAAVLTTRLGIKKVNVDLISNFGFDYYTENKTKLTFGNKISKLLCQTEVLLENETDPERMYKILLERAKLSSGVKVEVENAEISFGKKTLFKNLSFIVPAGGKLIIQGENGCGKTTLLNAILGTKNLDTGMIKINGKSPKNLEKRTIAYIKQSQNLENFPVSAQEVVKMGLTNGLKKKEALWQIETAMKRTDCFLLKDRNYFTLSGGERQKVALARCLCQKAKLLLLDEPTSFLDKKSQSNLIQILKSFEKQSPTIIIVTHDLEFLRQLTWPILKIEGQNDD